jgi:hypothetical protein
MEPEDWDLSGEDLDSLERDAYQKIAQLRSNPSHSPNPFPPSSSSHSAKPPSLPQGARALPPSFKLGGANNNNTNNNNGIYAFPLLLHHLIYIIYFALYLLLVIMY